MSKLKNLIRNLGALSRAESLRLFTSSNVAGSSLDGSANSSAISVAGANKPAENSVLAYACLIARREAIGGAPLVVSNADDEALESGPVVDLLAKPNAEDDWDQFIRKVESNLTLWNVAALHLGPPTAPPEQLVPLHPQGLVALSAMDGPTGTPRIGRWQYTDPTTGQQREFAPEEVIVHFGYNPHAPLAALSPLRPLDRTLKSELAAREQNLGLFLNDGSPSGYLHTEQAATKEQMDQILDAWNQTHRGYLRAHKTAALWGGLKYDRLQLSPQELQFLESLRSMRLDYYMVFRVYPAMLAEMTGETGLSQGSSTDSQRTAWWEDVGIPELRLIASLLQRVADRFGATARGVRRGRALTRTQRRSLVLLRANGRARPAAGGEGGVFVWFNDMAVPALSRARWSRIDALVKLSTTLGYPPDEMADYLDLGLPEHPDNLGRVPFSAQTIGGEPPPAPEPRVVPEAPPLPTGENPPAASQAADQVGRSASGQLVGRVVPNAPSPSIESALLRVEHLCRAASRSKEKQRFDAFCAPREKAAARKWSGFFIDQRTRVLARLDAEPSARAEKAGAIDASMGRLFPRDKEDPQLIARLSGLFRQHLADGADFFAAETGIPPPAGLQLEADPRFEEALKRRQIQGLEVNNTTEKDLREILTESYDAGETVADLGRRFAAYYKDKCVGDDSPRPLTAARTQTAGIVNEGRMIAALEVGGLLKGWLHGDPADPREAHIIAERQYAAGIPLTEKFVVNGHECDQPGDTALPVEEVANCTCSVRFMKAPQNA